jgi:cytochrome c biogenesis protein CcmG, thiol:disulfide interchange protein DsbE
MTEMTESLPNLPDEAAPASRAVLIWRAVFVLVPLIFVVFLAIRLGTAKTEHRAEGLAPPLEFTTFDSETIEGEIIKGETINLDNLRGQGVMVNFWASWCDPCREEAALLESTWRREKGNGLVFLGLDYLDQEPAAKAYLAEYDITYPNGPDLRSQVARRYGISGVPETFFIDPEGKIVDIIVGPITSQAQMDGYLDKIRPKEK